MLIEDSKQQKPVFKIQVQTKDGKLKLLDEKFKTKSAAVAELKNILTGMNNGDKCENISHLYILEINNKKKKDQVMN